MPTSCDPAWEKLRVCWKNTRRDAGRIEHPHHVLHAILLPLVKAARFPGDPVPAWCWRPEPGWPDEVVKGCAYAVEVLFPLPAGSSPEATLGARFTQVLQRAPPPRNFRLEGFQPSIRQTLAGLEAAHGLDVQADEICLNFRTPLFWPLQTKVRLSLAERWQLDSYRLCHLLHHRLAHLFGVPVPAGEAERPELAVRTYTARLADPDLGHRSRSGSGHRMLLGWLGPIYVRGEWQALLPQLLLCSELLLGSNSTIGQGCFSLHTGRPHFDEHLADAALWRRAGCEVE